MKAKFLPVKQSHFIFIIRIITVFSLLTVGCTNNNQDEESEVTTQTHTPKLFQLQNSNLTDFWFTNNIIETTEINYLTYGYLYNGAGVAVGDFNNDEYPDIYMCSNFGTNKLFINNGNFHFTEITEQAGLKSELNSTGATFVDINSDGWLDIYVCNSHSTDINKRRNNLYINNKDNTFTDLATEYNLDDPGYSNQAYFFDYDIDGDLDMFLINHRMDFHAAMSFNKKGYLELNKSDTNFINFWPFLTSRMYEQQDDGKFKDVSVKAGVEGFNYSLSASIADFNQDGYPDIYVANDFLDPDNYYINNGDGTFTDQLSTHFSHISQNSMGSDVGDINNDGLLDLITVDMLAENNYRNKQLKGPAPYDKYHLAVQYGLHHQVMRNNLQLNNGDGTFSEIGTMAGLSHTDWSWSPLFRDFDNDGSVDLFISNGYYRDPTDLDYLKYESVDAVKKAGGRQNLNPLDLIALMPQNSISNYMFRNSGTLKFEDVTGNWGLDQKINTNGAATADLDNDGDLDLILNNAGSPSVIYKNTLREFHLNESKYIKIKFYGPKGNSYGIGTKVLITDLQGNIQYKELSTSSGYLSASEPILHFGVGNDSIISKINVHWPDGKSQILNNVPSDTTLILSWNDAKEQKINIHQITEQDKEMHFKQVSVKGLNNYRHSESNFNDFKSDPLIDMMYSNRGPFIEIGDINGDKIEDLIIGGASGHGTTVYLQDKSGEFQLMVQQDLLRDANYEDMDLLLLDYDNDQDLDLYIVSGSSEFNAGDTNLKDRLYSNDGKGNFIKTENILPDNKYNGTCVIEIDLDKNGFPDLFIGSSSYKGNFPIPSKCQILINRNGTYSDITSTLFDNNINLGIITDAVFADVYGGEEKELITVGQWEPIRIFELDQTSNSFIDISTKCGLQFTGGSWNCITAVDIDNDGDIDLLAGNRGTNSFYKASKERPAKLIFADFDNNNSIDPFQFYYFKDDSPHPRASLDEAFVQLPSIRKKFLRYNKYSQSGIDDIFSASELSTAGIKEIHLFESILLKNSNKDNFELLPFPNLSQAAPVNCIFPLDFDDDSIKDIIMVGNNYGVDSETGRYDAVHGITLHGTDQPDQHFDYIHAVVSGFKTKGDCREVAKIRWAKDNQELIIVSENNGSLQLFEIK